MESEGDGADAGTKTIAQINKEKKEAALVKRKKKIVKFLDHYIVVTVMTIITIYALFFDDLRENCRRSAFSVPTGHVPYGVTNETVCE